jgi:hypothetical protein
MLLKTVSPRQSMNGLALLLALSLLYGCGDAPSSPARLSHDNIRPRTSPSATTLFIRPSQAVLTAGNSLQFNASRTGAVEGELSWLVNGVVGGDAASGTISPSGLYSAPQVAANTQAIVAIMSSEDPRILGNAAVTIMPAPSPVIVSVSPHSASLYPNQTQQFTADVAGTTNHAIRWLVDGNEGGNSSVGTITATGVYTAPLSTPPVPSVTITGVSSYESEGSASAVVTIMPAQAATPVSNKGQSAQHLKETAIPADSLVDSIGVNIHMTYGNTAYGNVTAVKEMLSMLGLRHVRDGGKYYVADAGYNQNEFNSYAQVSSLGIGFDLILSFCGGTDPNPITPSIIAALHSLAANNNVKIDSFEGPNEIDLGGDPNWVANTRAFMESVYSSNTQANGISKIPVLGASLAGQPNDWTLLGNMTAYEDAGNMHPYANTQYPSFNFAPDLANEQKISGSQNIYITEAGWSNAMNAADNSPNVTEDVASRYVGRLFLETMLRGWPRTYVYELVDEMPDPGLTNTQEHYGLFRNDFSAKPAATTIANMITLMSDKGYSVTPSSLSYSLTTPSPAVHHLLFQKHDGSYWLALWQEVSDWNGWTAQGTQVTNPDVAVTLTLPTAASSIETYRPHDSSSIVDSISNQQTVTLMVPDHPLFVKFVLLAF